MIFAALILLDVTLLKVSLVMHIFFSKAIVE